MGSIPVFAQWVKDPTLLWLWHRPAATFPTGPLAWEPPYAVGVPLKDKKTPPQKKVMIDWKSMVFLENLIQIGESLGRQKTRNPIEETFFFFFLVMPMAHRSSQARDQTCASAATQATMVTPDP